MHFYEHRKITYILLRGFYFIFYFCVSAFVIYLVIFLFKEKIRKPPRPARKEADRPDNKSKNNDAPIIVCEFCNVEQTDCLRHCLPSTITEIVVDTQYVHWNIAENSLFILPVHQKPNFV